MILRTGIKISVNLEQRIYISINKCMISVKINQKGRKKILNFSQELQKDKSLQTLSPSKHFEHEYIIKPSKDLIES